MAMIKEKIRARIEEIGIIPAIRLSSAPDALFAAEAVSESGIPIVEVTLAVPGAIKVIEVLVRSNSELIIGAGTVPDIDAAQRCLDAGVTFLTTPGLDLDIVDFALKQNVLSIPGALTPTEVANAWKAGADFVKVFPCSAAGGASYIRTLKLPFPNVPMIASGGVNLQTVGDFILAGAVAVGVGRDMVRPDAIQHHEQAWIRELARRYLRKVKEARGHVRA